MPGRAGSGQRVRRSCPGRLRRDGPHVLFIRRQSVAGSPQVGAKRLDSSAVAHPVLRRSRVRHTFCIATKRLASPCCRPSWAFPPELRAASQRPFFLAETYIPPLPLASETGGWKGDRSSRPVRQSASWGTARGLAGPPRARDPATLLFPGTGTHPKSRALVSGLRCQDAFFWPQADLKAPLTKMQRNGVERTGAFEAMRHIHLAEGLRLRFPGRDENFDQGVEIGMLAVLMDMGTREFTRWISSANLDQARALAKQLGYHAVEGAGGDGWTELVFRSGRARPQLKLVHSA